MSMKYFVFCINNEEDKSYYDVPNAQIGQRFVRMAFDISNKIYTSRIHKNDEGYECFDVVNVRNNTSNSFFNRMFWGRPGDAIAAVMDGEGDEISIDRGSYIHVWKYLDREYGEAVRKATIEKYKDSGVWYVICSDRCLYPSEYGGIVGGSIYTIDKRVSHFDSEEAAVKAREILCRTVVETVVRYLKENDGHDIIVHAPKGYEVFEGFLDSILLTVLNVKEELFYGDNPVEDVLNDVFKTIRVDQLISIKDKDSESESSKRKYTTVLL